MLVECKKSSNKAYLGFTSVTIDANAVIRYGICEPLTSTKEHPSNDVKKPMGFKVAVIR